MTPGRILLITWKQHKNKLALLLNTIKSKTVMYKVLVLTDGNSTVSADPNKDDLWFHMLGLADESVFLPMVSASHEVLTITPSDVFEISGKTIKVILLNLLLYITKRV